MNNKDKNLNFTIEILLFTAFVMSAYFFIGKIEFIAIGFAFLMCIYSGFKTFRCIKDRDGLKIIAILTSIFVLVIIIHILIVAGTQNPVPMLLLFIITNLFFVYNLILYVYYKYRILNLIVLIILWILCDGMPIMLLFILSAGLSN
ncbi:hypothetical protein H2684_01320 [Clostridium sp. cel8]|jgi:hypothetical protein|uniref:hypothetical protein n=1 Tax=unclassified Clostridium TaxID=2614128 RepID=UPI0015F4CC33|nr:hypothetical protein [Clostridium sp. cel8]MBA5849960.1 hypothetical protein [Clostridium sp. cel8]